MCTVWVYGGFEVSIPGADLCSSNDGIDVLRLRGRICTNSGGMNGVVPALDKFPLKLTMEEI